MPISPERVPSKTSEPEKRPESQEGPMVPKPAPNFLSNTNFDDVEREGVLNAIQEVDTNDRVPQEIILPDLSMANGLEKYESELGRYVSDVLHIIRVQPRHEYLKQIDMFEKEIARLKDTATSHDRARAEGIIKSLKFQQQINQKIESGQDLTSIEFKYKKLDERIDQSHEILKESLNTLRLLTKDITSDIRQTIDRAIDGKKMIDEEIVMTLKQVINTLVVDGQTSDEVFAFNELIVEAEEALKHETDAQQNKEEILNTWLQVA